MDNFQKLRNRSYGILLLANILVLFSGIAVWIAVENNGQPLQIAFVVSIAFMSLVFCFALIFLNNYLLKPLKILWQTILHLSPDTVNIPPPEISKRFFGYELVTSLNNRLLNLARTGYDGQKNTAITGNNRSVIDIFPLPLFTLDKNQKVTYFNKISTDFFNLGDDVYGKPAKDLFSFEFSGDITLADWMNDCQKNKITDSFSWQRVRLKLSDSSSYRQFDLAAQYNRDNKHDAEFIITIFDRSNSYGEDDNALSFIALAVHELRTPLTMVRGYVEVLEEEIGPKLDDELQDFLSKLRISTDQLTDFVTMVLHVVKIDENQLTLNLISYDWGSILNQVLSSSINRAAAKNIELKLQIEGELPEAAIDLLSASQALNNLLDNAIKYSSENSEIIISSKINSDKMIETTIQDFGVGIPENVMPHVFEKFYRNHRTRSNYGGTGLGLYLTKAVILAHGGNIWVQSKPGEGSSFSFTIQPFTEAKNSNDNIEQSITRQAHGWIKNHSMYRR